MNILTESLPKEIKIDGMSFKINTDFRVWMRFVNGMFHHKEDVKFLLKVVCDIFEEIPPNLRETLTAMSHFCSYKSDERQNVKSECEKKRIFDYDYDANLIFAAFMQQYGINLTEVNLHWWVFKSLFDGLSDDTLFVKVLQFRMVDVSTIKDKEQKAYYLRMKKQYALPDMRSDEEKERAFFEGVQLIV